MDSSYLFSLMKMTAEAKPGTRKVGCQIPGQVIEDGELDLALSWHQDGHSWVWIGKELGHPPERVRKQAAKRAERLKAAYGTHH